ncbi:type I DNA topoisomerase [Bacteroides reticulotermitis]|uniref:DNA topoisomerase 1 n=2 Tax=Bacteroides reticulotermitis TaxID=1133319 RepID=W4UVJ5_9BACE|nr:type I DNA topoisomerase [Bacteroides reticulotermitis]MBB4044298.1 DNA topoisomerase-1 [Bacteroides reticulotermitis]GAE84847.1 DNA topoisomerase I [Bacteroides reticulotermitis JCM 10512]
MQKNLVIVESPAKAKTIEKFLGKDFKVLSSYGHIRDLKKKEFSIDVENDFKPDYEIPADKRALVNTLKAEAKNAETVWLASDEDREGEAIAWHLYEVLKLKPENTKRIVFHEITKSAILKAIEQPRSIDLNLVNAQQARRILDRIVGFELSPILWRKVKPALSAGRVQSVAVRLIVEREREVNAFKTEASYRITAIFLVPEADGRSVEMKAELTRRIKTKEEANALLASCQQAFFTIEDITTRPVKKTPPAPFTTSTLQQEAARKLGYTVAQTMIIAQRLYESGYITYMRTDSVNLSEFATQGSRAAIAQMMGERYIHSRRFETKTKGAQEAHEAIRPTYMEHQAVEGTAQEKKLYDLIWKRTIASQMADAELEKTTATISISNSGDVFTAVGEVIKFDGFLRVYRESFDDESDQEDESRLLPPLKKGQQLEHGPIVATERFTQRPARYTEASLVRKLEELGIGRPSTYAPTISTIQQREYVEKGNKDGEERIYNVLTLVNQQTKDEDHKEVVGAEKSKLFPTDIGTVVNDFLTEYFPDILDYNFTASVEKEFDEVAEGETQWSSILKNFYDQFHPAVEKTLSTKMEHRVGERILGTEPETNKTVSVKIGRFGPVVQIGTAEDEEKPRFAPMKKGQSIETISLEEALELFKLPRTLGEYEGKVVNVGIGRFGPYIQHSGVYVSLPKTLDPMEVTLDEAEQLILEKRAKDAQRHIKKFEEEPDLEIMNGRYGPYIAYKGTNYKIPKDIVPTDLNLKSCMELIKIQDEKGATSPAKGRKRTAKKK